MKATVYIVADGAIWPALFMLDLLHAHLLTGADKIAVDESVETLNLAALFAAKLVSVAWARPRFVWTLASAAISGIAAAGLQAAIAGTLPARSSEDAMGLLIAAAWSALFIAAFNVAAWLVVGAVRRAARCGSSARG